MWRNVEARKIVALVLGTAAIWFAVSKLTLRVAGQTQAAIAFTAVAHEVTYRFPLGELAHEGNKTIAFRTDGSKVETYIHVDPGNKDLGMKDIWDAPQKLWIRSYDLIKATSTFPMTPKQLMRLRPPANSSCGSAPEIGKQTGAESLLNLAVLKIERNDDHAHFIYWRAPAAACLELKKILYEKDPGGKEVLVETDDVTSFTWGEPDASLFAVSREYTELSPIQIRNKIMEQYPSVKLPDSHGEQAAEQSYHKLRHESGLE